MAAFTFVDLVDAAIYPESGRAHYGAGCILGAGLAASGLGAAMFFIISPVWGILADRFGRKAMVMRAMFGGAIILSLDEPGAEHVFDSDPSLYSGFCHRERLSHDGARQ